MFKRISLAPLLVAGVLVVFVFGKTWLMPSRQVAVTPVVKPAIDAEAAARRLSGAIVLHTVSSDDDPTLNAAEFDKLHLLPAQRYPKQHVMLKYGVIGQHALLYPWIGTDDQKNDPMTARLSGVAQEMKSPRTNATLWTTAALTIMQAGNKDNVPPGRGDAAVNFRILPGDTLSVFSGAVAAPGPMTAFTDSRQLRGVRYATRHLSPMRLGPEDLSRFHGTNERISVANYAEMIEFYRQQILNSGGPSGAHLAA